MFHLRTLGGLGLERDGAPFDAVPRKALALMAVVAAHPAATGVTRDRLMALLWPESGIDRARGALKQTVHVLRQQLGSPDVLIGNAELRLNPAHVTSDVAAFKDAVREGDAERAVQLYGGPFLDGIHIDSSIELEQWSDAIRAELSRIRADAVEELALAAAARGEHTRAAGMWQSLQVAEPLSGRIAINLMLAFEAAGDRTAALRHARVHTALLQQELNAEPDAEIVALAERLLRAPPRTMVAETPPHAPPAPPASVAPIVHEAPSRSTARRRTMGMGYALGGIGLLLAFASVVLSRRVAPPASGVYALERTRVVVGAFENQTGDSDMAPLGHMASDWVTRGLASTGRLYVLDAATLYAQADEEAATSHGTLELTRRNGAALAVAGRIYRGRDSLLFTASIFDVASGRVLNTVAPAAAVPGDPLPAIEEVRQHIAAALVTAIDPRAISFLQGELRTPRYDSYRAFVAAHESYWRGRVAESVVGFRRAAALDTTFLGALVWLASSSATLNQCEYADSLTRQLEVRQDQLTAADLATVRGTRARCNRDWDHGLQNMRDRSAAEPGSMIARWTVAANARRANRPAEALGILQALDPDHDLGWMADSGRVMYWREVNWAEHMLGDTSGAQRAVARLTLVAPRRLATAYFASLAQVDAGHPSAAVRALDDVESLAVDPPIVAGEVAGRAPAEEVGTPAWVLYQIGTELLAAGDSAQAVVLARRAVRWLASRATLEQTRTPSRYLRVLALELEGRVDSAATLVRQLARDVPDDVEVRGRLGVLAARLGHRSDAQAVDAWLARRPPTFPPGGPQFERARIAAVLGDRDRALQLLETLPYRAHPVDVVFFRSDPAFATLRGDARWKRIWTPRG